jgi:hypothetical protein
MRKALNALDYPVNREKVRKLMREANVSGPPAQKAQDDDEQQSQSAA